MIAMQQDTTPAKKKVAWWLMKLSKLVQFKSFSVNLSKLRTPNIVDATFASSLTNIPPMDLEDARPKLSKSREPACRSMPESYNHSTGLSCTVSNSSLASSGEEIPACPVSSTISPVLVS